MGGVGGDGVGGGDAAVDSVSDVAGDELVRQDDWTVPVEVDADAMLAVGVSGDVGDGAGGAVAEEVSIGVSQRAVLGAGDDVVTDVEVFAADLDGWSGEGAIGEEQGLGASVELASDGVGLSHHP